MIIKPFDPRCARIAAFERRLVSTHGRGARSDIESELTRRRAGRAAEKNTAYILDHVFGANPNRCVLHGLRISHEGRTAQIDHLLVNRCLEVYVIETKSRVWGMSVNEHGDFSTLTDGRWVGIASPIEQAERHAEVLRAVLGSGRVWRPRRFGIRRPVAVRNAIAIDAGTHIERPRKSRLHGLDRLVRSDALHRLYDRDAGFDRPWWNVRLNRTDLQFVLSFGSRVTMARFASGLAALDETAVHGSNDRPHCARCTTTLTAGIVDYCRSQSHRFRGQLLCMPCQVAA